MKNLLSSLLITFTIISIFTSCKCSYTLVYCTTKDGTKLPINMPKNEKCAKTYYEDAVKSLQVTTDATVDVISKVTVNADVGVKNEASQLREKLNQESIRLQEKLKASILGLRMNPCGNSERYFKLIEAIDAKDIELQKVKTMFNNSSNSSQLKEAANYEYLRGKEDGKNMATLNSTIEKYYNESQKFPETLDDLGENESISKLGKSRLEYKKESDNKITIRFAGGDYALGTVDDKIYEGTNGKISQKG